MLKTLLLSLLLLVLPAVWCQAGSHLPIDKIIMPENFSIEVYSSGIKNVRGIDFSENGILFAGSRCGNVYAITRDKKVFIIDKGLNDPVGVDFYDGDLYVSATSKILKYENILEHLYSPTKPVVINASFPERDWHGRKYIKVGPDKKLYVPVGASCNACEQEDDRFATLMRMDLNGSNLEIYAKGIRNTFGFDWHPGTNEIWFTDNGRDLMDDGVTPDELNRVHEKGQHFGFPFLHGKDVKDPVQWGGRPAIDFTTPELELPAHVESFGMRFYTGKMFPENYRSGIFIAEHGSWEQEEKTGYRISFISVKDNKVKDYSIFASGWLKNGSTWGHPVDVEVGPEGALYISDDRANAIYKITYKENSK